MSYRFFPRQLRLEFLSTAFLVAVSAISFLYGAQFTFAADLTALSQITEVQIGNQFEVTAHLTTYEGYNVKEFVNAIEGRLIYPSELLTVKTIALEQSIINQWIFEPNNTLITPQEGNPYGEIYFSGGMIGGWKGEKGKLFGVLFEAKKEGQADISFQDVLALNNDGEGSKMNVKTISFQVKIKPGSTTSQERVEQTKTPSEQSSETSQDQKPQTPTDSKPLSPEAKQRVADYEDEKRIVKEKKIVTKDFALAANKCEFIVMNSRAAGWDVDQSKKVSEYFDDINRVGASYCAPHADYAYEQGIVTGRSKGIFGVDGAITRYEVAVIIARQLSDSLVANASTDFTDDAEIVSWAKGAVSYLKKQGIFKGFDNLDGTFTFGGESNILKIDGAIVLWRTFGEKIDESTNPT